MELKKEFNDTLNVKTMFLQLLYIQLIMYIVQGLSGAIDGVVVGNFLTSQETIALGVVAPYKNIINSISSIIGGGSAIVCGRHMGRNQLEKIKGTFTISIGALIVIGLVISSFTYFGSNTIAYWLGARQEALESTITYLKGVSFGIIPFLLVPYLMTNLQTLDHAKDSFAGVVMMILFNIICSLSNIFIFKGGIFGMGISFAATNLLTIGFLAWRCSTVKNLSISIKDAHIKELGTIVKLGSPNALGNILYSTRDIVFNSKIVIYGGQVALNSLSINNMFSPAFDATNIAVLNVVSILGSVFAGEEDKESIKKVFKVATKNGVLLSLIRMTICIVFGKSIVALFGGKGEAARLAYIMLLIYTISSPFNMFTVTFQSLFCNLQKIIFTNIMMILNAFVFPVSIGLLLGEYIGVYAIFISYVVSEMCILTFIFVTTWIRNGKFPNKLEYFFNFDKVFENSKKLTFNINTIQEVVDVSKKIEEFCKENGIDSKRSMLSGLCLEEIAGNVVEHGFTKTKKKCTIDLLVSITNDSVKLRVRDNAPSFDPNIKLGQVKDDPTKNIGIKMVSKLAKKMQYQTYYGMNVLSIEL